MWTFLVLEVPSACFPLIFLPHKLKLCSESPDRRLKVLMILVFVILVGFWIINNWIICARLKLSLSCFSFFRSSLLSQMMLKSPITINYMRKFGLYSIYFWRYILKRPSIKIKGTFYSKHHCASARSEYFYIYSSAAASCLEPNHSIEDIQNITLSHDFAPLGVCLFFQATRELAADPTVTSRVKHEPEVRGQHRLKV